MPFEESAPFTPDRRGGVLEAYKIIPSERGHSVMLRGPVEIVHQLLALPPHIVSYRWMRLDDAARPAWTHAVAADGPPRAEVAASICSTMSCPCRVLG